MSPSDVGCDYSHDDDDEDNNNNNNNNNNNHDHYCRTYDFNHPSSILYDIFAWDHYYFWCHHY